MGGCSSKPKTTEFEGAMDLREGKPQVEPATKSVDSEKKVVDVGLKSIDREQKSSSEHSLKTLFVENERGGLRDVLLESEKQPIVGFNPEANERKAEQKSEETCDQSSAKVAEGETFVDQKELSVTEGKTLAPAVIAEKEIAMEEETQKEQVFPVAEALELQKEAVVANKETVEPQEEPVAVASEAEITKTHKEPLISSEETLEIQKEPVLTEAETLEAQKEPIVAEEGASEPPKEPIIAEEETLELEKEPIVECDKTLELQKESIVAEKGLQEEAPREVEKESGQSQFQETIYEDKEAKLGTGPGYGGEGKQGEEESKEGARLGDGRGTIACQADSATDDGSVAQAEEREEEILEKASEPVEEEKAQSEEIDEAKKELSALITSASLDHHADTSAESLTTSSNPPSEVEENDTSCTVPHAMTTNESPRDATLAVDKPHPIAIPITTVPDCPPVEEDQIQVQEADEVASMSNDLQPEPEMSAESYVEPTAAPGENIVAPEAEIPLSAPDIQPEHDSLVRELSTKASTTEGELALEEISLDGKNSSSPGEVDSSTTETSHIGVPKDSMDLVQGEQVSSPVICNANELNPDILSTSDQVTAPQDSGVSEGLVADHEAGSQPPSEIREVTATTENSSSLPEVRLVQVAADGNETAKPISSKDISAQEIAAPDIDEVLEKLASEFERQESLSRSIP